MRQATAPAERVYRSIDGFVKLAVGYLGGGQDVSTGIREFRDPWHERAVPEGVNCYEPLDGTGPTTIRGAVQHPNPGEKRRFSCVSALHPRAHADGDAGNRAERGEGSAARELDDSNAHVDDRGVLRNLPDARLTKKKEGCWERRLRSEWLMFGALVVLFPFVLRMIGRQWTEASRARRRDREGSS